MVLTDEQWELIDPHLPRSTARTGRPAADRRLMFEAALYVLTEGVGGAGCRPSGSARGRPRTTTSTGGGGTASSTASPGRCWPGWTRPA